MCPNPVSKTGYIDIVIEYVLLVFTIIVILGEGLSGKTARVGQNGDLDCHISMMYSLNMLS